MIKLEGLTPLQMELCDTIWNMQSQEQVYAWFETLPRSLQHQAYVLMQMIMLEVMDQEPLEDLSAAQDVIRSVQ